MPLSTPTRAGARSAHDFLADLAELFATIDETAPIVVGIVIVRAIEHVVEVDVQQTEHLARVADDVENHRSVVADDLVHDAGTRLPVIALKLAYDAFDGRRSPALP